MISVTHHEKRLRELACVVSARRPVTLHHCHGGSMKDLSWHVGMSQRQNPYLQIPLHAHYHVGARGIDTGEGVLRWERFFGTQVEHLNEIDSFLRYPVSIWELAQAWAEEHSKLRVVGGKDGRTNEDMAGD